MRVLMPRGGTFLTMITPVQSVRSKRVFGAQQYGDLVLASAQARAYANQFQEGWLHRSNGAPQIFVEYDKVAGGYILRPNPAFYPSKPWDALADYEKEKQ